MRTDMPELKQILARLQERNKKAKEMQESFAEKIIWEIENDTKN